MPFQLHFQRIFHYASKWELVYPPHYFVRYQIPFITKRHLGNFSMLELHCCFMKGHWCHHVLWVNSLSLGIWFHYWNSHYYQLKCFVQKTSIHTQQPFSSLLPKPLVVILTTTFKAFSFRTAITEFYRAESQHPTGVKQCQELDSSFYKVSPRVFDKRKINQVNKLVGVGQKKEY